MLFINLKPPVITARYRALLTSLLLMICMSEKTYADEFDAGVAAYENGLYEQAEALWLQVKAGPNFANAAFNLAVMYEAEQGKYASNERVVKWYRVAAQEGLAEAQFNYGGLFYEGIRVAKKLDEAIYWWSQAGNQGHAQAQYNLGVLLYEGKQIPQDLNNAYEWFILAVDGDYKPAEAYLLEVAAVLEQQTEAIKNSLSLDDWNAHEMWLFHQDPEDYTLELFSSTNFDEAFEFVTQAKIHDVARYYQIAAKVVVVAGVFSSDYEAREAISNLTDDVKALLPSPKLFSEVHEQIRNN